MPKRTNEFQQLVLMIQNAFAPSGAKITESAMVDGIREIDILIESEVGPYLMKIAVEAKDEKRPLDVITIEQMIGKYKSAGGIAVNHVVVVAHNGFTDTAKIRAEQANIELLTLQEAERSDWVRKIPQEMTYKMTPHVHWVEIEPSITSKNGRDPLVDGRIVCKCHGHDYGSPLQWVNWLFDLKIISDPTHMTMLEEEAKRRNGDVLMTIDYPMPNYELNFEGEKHPFNKLKFELHVAGAKTPVKWSTYKMCSANKPDKPDKTVDQMDVKFGRQRMRILFPNGPKSKKIHIRLDPVPHDTSSELPPTKTYTMNIGQGSVHPYQMPPIRPLFKERPKPTSTQTKPQPINKEERTGRNDACSCGSGKKYKNCHMKQDMK